MPQKAITVATIFSIMHYSQTLYFP